MTLSIQAHGLEEAVKIMREARFRIRAIRRRFLFLAARQVKREVVERIPANNKNLRHALRVKRISGLPAGVDGQVIYAVPSKKVLGGTEAESAVIYVASKPHLLFKVPPNTQILEDFSPWTTNTLPYPPDPITADVVVRRVSEREFNTIQKRRRRERSLIRRRMVEAGIPPSKEVMVFEAIPDVAMESLRLEFGLGGAQAKSHWRLPLVRFALRGGVLKLARRADLRRALADPNFMQWRTWLRADSMGLSAARARKYEPFQKRLGVRVQK